MGRIWLIILFIMFGIERLSRRYSTSNNLKGNKITMNEMGRTQSLKFRKVNEIQSARTHLHNSQNRTTYKLMDNQIQTNSLFFSRSRVLRGTPLRRSIEKSQGLLVESTRNTAKQQSQMQQSAQKQGKIYFYSSNLDQNTNLFMNRLLNKSQHERKQKIRQIQQNINLNYINNMNSSKTQNQFWRKMKRSLSRRQRQQKQIDSNRTFWQGIKLK